MHGPTPLGNYPTQALAIGKEENRNIKRKENVASMSFHAKRHKPGDGSTAEAASEENNHSIQEKDMCICAVRWKCQQENSLILKDLHQRALAPLM